MPQHPLSHVIAARVATIANLRMHNRPDGEALIDRNRSEIDRVVHAFMPSGSGFDNGTEFSFDKSTESKLVFNVGFHHMNDVGMYDGWTYHVVTVESTFTSPNIKVSGRDRNGIKDYIADAFLSAIREHVECIWNEEAKDFDFINSNGWKA